MDDTHVKLLLVEDDAGDALLISAELGTCANATFDVTRPGTLAAACWHLNEESFDVVLLDLRLPDSAGLGSVDKLRAIAGRVPILVLTGMEDEELGMRALQRGAQDYLVKGWAMGGGGSEWRTALRHGAPDFL